MPSTPTEKAIASSAEIFSLGNHFPDHLLIHGLEIVVLLLGAWTSSMLLDWITRKTPQGHIQAKGLRVVRWLPLLRLIVWFLTAIMICNILLKSGQRELLFLVVPFVLALGLASRDLLRNLIAGLIISMDRRFEVGDVIHVEGKEGEVRSIGLRCVQILASEGHAIEIPNYVFLSSATSNITPDVSDIQTRIEMVLPGDTQVARIREIAYLAASVSRYASPRRSPEVFIDTHFDQNFLLRMTILGFVFDPAFEDHFRSDVVEMVREHLAQHAQGPNDHKHVQLLTIQ